MVEFGVYLFGLDCSECGLIFDFGMFIGVVLVWACLVGWITCLGVCYVDFVYCLVFCFLLLLFGLDLRC